MMDRSPEHLIPPLAEAGGDIITVHIEGVADVDQTIDIILEAGAAPAVAIRVKLLRLFKLSVSGPRTPVSALWSVADRIRRVLVMTVEPGLGGQEFIPDTLPKISEALSMMQKPPHPDTSLATKAVHSDNRFEIAVDGGIKSGTIGSDPQRRSQHLHLNATSLQPPKPWPTASSPKYCPSISTTPTIPTRSATIYTHTPPPSAPYP